jgi:hypothetical protein
VKWPERSTLKFIDSSAKEPIANLLFFVEVLTRQRNDFSLGPLITDSEGRAILTRDQIRKAIDDSARDFPMDYSGAISDCTGEIRITVDDKDALDQRIDRVKRFYPRDAMRLKELATTSSNSMVESRQATVPLSREVTVEVKRIPRGRNGVRGG